MEAPTTTWIVTMVILAVFAVVLLSLVRILRRIPMMRRCPETGSVAFVRLATVADPSGKHIGVAVTHCDLWPDRKDCAQGCVARAPETGSGAQVDLDLLRPLGPR